MNRDRWLLLISIIIFSGLIVHYLRPTWARLVSKKGAATSVAARPAAGQSAIEKAPVQASVVTRVRGEVDGGTSWGRNPFLTEEETRATNTERLRVNTIIFGPPKAVAVIDGRAVMVGERINEERVVEIRPDAVILEREGRKKILRVSDPTLSIAVKEGKR
jgi:hypothetical protein